MNVDLVEAGLELASSKKRNVNRGTNYLDRTVYFTKQLEDTDGNLLYTKEGKPLVTNTAFALAGTYWSDELYETILQVEKEFKKLNEAFRAQMERDGDDWRRPRKNQDTLFIQGVT